MSLPCDDFSFPCCLGGWSRDSGDTAIGRMLQRLLGDPAERSQQGAASDSFISFFVFPSTSVLTEISRFMWRLVTDQEVKLLVNNMYSTACLSCTALQGPIPYHLQAGDVTHP